MSHKDILKMTKDSGKAKDFFKDILAFTINPDGLLKLMDTHFEEINIIDVRDYEDYIKGHIPYAVHVPMDQLDEQMNQFSKDRINVVYTYCPLCYRAKMAALHMADKGFPVMELTGGFKGWKKRDMDIIENDESDYPG